MRCRTAFVLIAPLVLVSSLWAQQPAAAPPAPMAGHAHAMGPSTSGGGCGGDGAACPGMAMMAQMDSANAQIASLTEAMNKASGSKKTEAMAAVVNALVQDRLRMQGMMKMMHEHMEKMMMGGMGSMGGMGGMSAGSSACAAGMDCCKGQGASCPATPPPAPAPKE